jgi:uncharacterized protein YyaL (SSP411 family)
MTFRVPLFRAVCAGVLAAMALYCAATETNPTTNRLAQEKSPYLRQHATNPVDWYPWGPEAFARARTENKLIFLSIGYSTCHWCHVMERESFANPEVAAFLNARFICIKVDREERPDVDRLYMSFVQASTGTGGWPLNVWLTPDLKPVFGGVYFPPESRAGQPGLRVVSESLASHWAASPDKLLAQAEEIFTALVAESQGAASAELPPVAKLREKLLEQIRDNFDEKNGGFNQAPKFPDAVVLDFLLDESTAGADSSRRAQAREMAVRTLRALATGGLHDPLGGGFHRYSVDAAWRVPHFEKMLYDQALITGALLTGWQLTTDPLLRDAAIDTLAYVERDLTDPEGGFYSAEDADSLPLAPNESEGRKAADREKQEGAFYIWTAAEIETVLGPKDAALFGYAFGVRPEGNVARQHGAELAEKNVLYRAHSTTECARKFGLDEASVRATLIASADRLSTARAQRPRPIRDDKIITAWNGLMISAYARAAQVLGEPGYATTATRAATFLREKLRDPATGRLFHSFRAGIRDDRGFAEDYTFLVQGLLDLYEATFDLRHLDWAVELQERQNELFWDARSGGYFANAAGDPGVLLRLKADSDGAEPSPNSVAVRNLARLATMLHRDDWLELAIRTARAFGPKLEQSPFDLPQMISALGWLERPAQQILIQGEPDDERTMRLVAEVWRRHLPRHVLLRIDRSSRPALEQKVEFVRALPADADAPPTAYVCENFACRMPTSDPAELARQLAPAPGK